MSPRGTPPSATTGRSSARSEPWRPSSAACCWAATWAGPKGARPGGAARRAGGSLGAQAYVQGYSREQEFEADQLGIRYLGAAGYDPARHGELPRGAAGRTTPTSQRLAGRAAARRGTSSPAGSAPIRARPSASPARSRPSAPSDARRARDRPRPLLAALDGMIYGEDPGPGLVRGRSFQHPGLRIAFEAPPGFRLQNSPDGRWRARTARAG